MVGILVSFWDGLFSGAMLALGRASTNRSQTNSLPEIVDESNSTVERSTHKHTHTQPHTHTTTHTHIFEPKVYPIRFLTSIFIQNLWITMDFVPFDWYVYHHMRVKPKTTRSPSQKCRCITLLWIPNGKGIRIRSKRQVVQRRQD